MHVVVVGTWHPKAIGYLMGDPEDLNSQRQGDPAKKKKKKKKELIITTFDLAFPPLDYASYSLWIGCVGTSQGW